MTQYVKDDISALKTKGEAMVHDFITKWLHHNNTSFWSPMKTGGLKLLRSTVKKVVIPIQNRLVELKEDRGLYARLLIEADSSKEVSLDSVLITHELSVVPRSLFSADGLLHQCLLQSAVMTFLKKN